jgi:ubiquinone/menaquinone biosynthesis C-methylase UbiE
MSMANPSQSHLARSVEAMYNAHPYPNRTGLLDRRSDQRYRHIYEEFLHIPLESLKGKIVLDAGCGTGENTWCWRRILDPSTSVIAVDHSHSSVEIARQNDGDLPLRPLFLLGSLLDLGLEKNSVDVIFCSGVLVAVIDPYRAYQELVRVLKPGGTIILIVYDRYGRYLHSFRRAVIGLLEREDIDRRARLGGRLFGRRMKKIAKTEMIPLEGLLYDQFGLPCESCYSVGQISDWFRRANIHYLGTWPPVEWSQLGKGLRFSYFFNQKKNWLKRVLLKIIPDTNQAPQRPPGFLTRVTMEALWAINQQEYFAISGRKEN